MPLLEFPELFLPADDDWDELPELNDGEDSPEPFLLDPESRIELLSSDDSESPLTTSPTKSIKLYPLSLLELLFASCLPEPFFLPPDPEFRPGEGDEPEPDLPGEEEGEVVDED